VLSAAVADRVFEAWSSNEPRALAGGAMFLNPYGPRLAKPLWQAWRFGKLGANGKNEPCWRKTRKAIRRSMQAQACD